jgi:hypothetical protein
MNNLENIYAAVVTKTGRPDRSKEIRQAVIDATMEYHTLGYFGSDIKSGDIFLGRRNLNPVDLRAVIPDFRALMKVTIPGLGKISRIPFLDADLSQPGYQLAGSMLQLNPPDLATRITLHYCTFPTAENSWIVSRYKDAIVALASFKVAALTGNSPLAQALAVEVGSIYPGRSGYKHKIMMENDSYEPDL